MELLSSLVSSYVGQVTDTAVISYAVFGVVALSAFHKVTLKGLAIFLARAVACLFVSAAVNVAVDWSGLAELIGLEPQTICSGVCFCGIVRDLPLPRRVAHMSIAASAWIYSAAVTVYIGSSLFSLFELVWLLRAAYMAVVILAVFLLDRALLEPADEVPTPFAALITAVCASGMLIQVALRLSSLGEVYGSDQVRWTMVVSLGCQAAELVAYAMFTLTIRSYNDLLRDQIVRAAAEKRIEALEAFRLSEQSYRELRHEVKNQYAYMRLLLERGDYERAEEFFASMELNANPAFSTVASGNQLVDDVVNLEIAKARAADIEVDARIVVPERLDFDELDLCSLFTNLLDNAIEACRGLEAGERSIALSATVDPAQGALVVRVSNPCAVPPKTDGRGRLVSSKGGPDHGHGTQIVRQLAEKYDGVADYHCEDGTFVARAMLVLPATDAGER